MSVLNNKALHEQLSIIMAALTKAAVAEICEVVDEGWAVLQLEVSRSRRENDDLRKKLHLIESIVVRGGGGGGTGGTGPVRQPEAPQQQRDRERGEAASGGAAKFNDVKKRRPVRTGSDLHSQTVTQLFSCLQFPDVVLIKDEDSDSNDSTEEGSRTSADGGRAAAVPAAPGSRRRRRRRRSRGNGEDPEKSSSSERQLTAGTQQNVSVFSLDSPRSEPGCSGQLLEEVQMDASESSCSYSAPMDPDVHLVQNCSLVSPSSGKQVYFGGALMESPSHRVDLDLDPAWTEQSKGPVRFVDGDAYGLKLISVSGSGPAPADCQPSGSRSATFQYEDGADVLTFGLYRDQPGRAQPSAGAHRKAFVCSVCNKSYANNQNLEVHMRIHTGERPFSCDQCGKKFTQSSHLKSHLNVHSGERPFVCMVCSKSFIVRYSLKLHMKKSHPGS